MEEAKVPSVKYRDSRNSLEEDDALVPEDYEEETGEETWSPRQYLSSSTYLLSIVVTVTFLFIVTIITLAARNNGSNIRRYGPSDTLVTYIYNESPTHRPNFEFFLRHGIHSAADWILVIQGESDVIVPEHVLERSNVRILNMTNECYDVGRHGELVHSPEAARYKRFIMMNGSVRGPFMPTWSEQCWTDAFLNKLNARTKLVGTTVNCHGLSGDIHPHLQSMILAADRTGIDILEPLMSCQSSWNDAVGVELQLAQHVLDAGYEVDALSYMANGEYHGNITAAMESCGWSDPNVYGFDGLDVSPFDVIFPKYHEKRDHEGLDKWTKWADGYGYNADDYCRQ